MRSRPPAADARDDPPGAERLLALSDGVVAIALTLLVLQLKVPSAAQVTDPASAADLAAQLGRGGNQLVSYVISYYVIALSIGIAWVTTDTAKYCWLLLAIAPRAAERWLARDARARH